ncbi:MAG: BatA domain-containing protein [Planctomycetes bacterium]|nr:BatA domain-containing protein [Planctomycetota bacterium]
MTFLFPAGLWALLAVPAVILLSLHVRRRREVVVPSLEIWRKVANELRDAGRLRRFRIDPLLALEVLLALALALAFSRPGWRGSAPRRPNLAVLVDVSLPMGARLSDRTTPLERARDVLGEVVGTGGTWADVELAASPGTERLSLGGDADLGAADAWAASLFPRPGRFDPEATLALWLAREGGEGPDRIVVLSDEGPPAGLSGDGVAWLKVAEGEGKNFAWTRLGFETTPEGTRRILAIAAREGEGAAPEGLVALARRADASLLLRRELTFDETGEVELVLDERELGSGAGDRLTIELARPDGSALADALPEDDRLYLARNPTVRVGLHGDRLAAAERALERWHDLGFERVAPGGPAPDIVLLSAQDEPAGWGSARAVLFPGSTSRGVTFAEEPIEGGWLDRSVSHPALSDTPLALLHVPRAHPLEVSPPGTRPLAWAGRTPAIWETPRGDLAFGFSLDEASAGGSEPPPAVPALLFGILSSVQRAPGHLDAYAPGDPVPGGLLARGVPGPNFAEGRTGFVEGEGAWAATNALDPDSVKVALAPSFPAVPGPPETGAPASETREFAPWLIGLAFGLTLLHGVLVDSPWRPR